MDFVLSSSALANPVSVGAATSDAALVTLGASAAVLLVMLLVLKEIIGAYAAEPHVTGTIRADALQSFQRAANSAIVPLAAVFGVTVLVKVLGVF